MSGIGHNLPPAEDARSYIDRVLRLKAEQDALAADIREVYAEAKAEGHDKTAMGNAVTIIRKREKKGDSQHETEAMTAYYLDAYNGTGTPVANIERAHTHAGDPEPDFDPETGEVLDSPPEDGSNEVGPRIDEEAGAGRQDDTSSPRGSDSASPAEGPRNPAADGSSAPYTDPPLLPGQSDPLDIPAFMDKRRKVAAE